VPRNIISRAGYWKLKDNVPLSDDQIGVVLPKEREREREREGERERGEGEKGKGRTELPR